MANTAARRLTSSASWNCSGVRLVDARVEIDPGVVHQDVKRAQGLGSFGDGVLHSGNVTHIQRKHDRAPAASLDCRGNRFEVRHRARGQRHVGASFGEGLRDGPSDPTTGAGDQSAAAIETEAVEKGHLLVQAALRIQPSLNGPGNAATEPHPSGKMGSPSDALEIRQCSSESTR